MSKIYKYLMIFTFGAAGYGAIEIGFRGRTHWTMLITGGICFVFIYMIALCKKLRSWQKWLLGCGVTTLVEFTVGVIVNIGLGWKVWSYADMPYNLLGQICPAFSGAWLLMCIPLMYLCQSIDKEIHR